MASFFDVLMAAAPAIGQGAAGYAQGMMIQQERDRERKRRERDQAVEGAKQDLILESLRLENEKRRNDLNAPPAGAKITVRRPTAQGDFSVSGDPSQIASVLPTLPAPSSPEPDAVNWQTVQTDKGLVQVNPRTGQTRPLGLQAPPRGTGAGGRRLTEMQAKMQVAYSRAVPALQQIEQFLGYDPQAGTFAKGRGDVPEESFLGRFTPGRYFQGADVQAYDQAAEAVASAILRIESGAAITEQELESYKRQFIPRPGDKPEVIRRKLESLRTTLEAIRNAAGITGDAGTSTGAPGLRPTLEGAARTFSPDNPFAVRR